MKKTYLYKGFRRKGILFICLLSLLLFASNASAYLSSYSFNLIYPNANLNGGMMDNFATVTVNLTAVDQATIIFDALDDYVLKNRAGVQLNAFVFTIANLSAGELAKGLDKNFSEFGDFNAAFSKLGELKTFSFDVRNDTVNQDWTEASQVLCINDQGMKAVAHIKPLAGGDTGYAAGNGSVVPIPGAFWLLGSGLVGIVAIRRRRAA